MSTPREIELKLECDEPDLTVLANHPLLQAAKPAEPELLTATYFDTAERHLRKAGLSLRVRREGDRTLQTVKAGSAAAGLFDRPEWERAVEGPRPDPAALEETPVAALLAEAGSPELEFLFTTVVERTTRHIEHGASRIAATLDQGRIETPLGDVPLFELELELVEGRASDLFALAQALGKTVPLRLGALSKGERGYALSEGTARRPSKAGPVELDEAVTAGEAFVRIAGACLRHLRLNEAVFLVGRDPEALHQIRVSLRRLRSAFTLFRTVLRHDARAATLRDEIKRVTEPFGRARNLDVFLSETLPAEIERRPDEPGLAGFRERLIAEREQAYDAVLATLESQAWRALLIDLVAWIETGPWRGGEGPRERDEPARQFAAAVLERLRRRIKKQGRHLERLEAEERHRVRIEAKKLRYGAEFFASLYPEKKARRRHKAFVATLSALQDHLGGLNDLATAHEVAAGLAGHGEGEAPAVPATGSDLFAAGPAAGNEAGAGDLVVKAAEAHEELIEVRPFWR